MAKALLLTFTLSLIHPTTVPSFLSVSKSSWRHAKAEQEQWAKNKKIFHSTSSFFASIA
jgi:hypothetical protein